MVNEIENTNTEVDTIANISMGSTISVSGYLQALCERMEGVSEGVIMAFDSDKNARSNLAQWPVKNDLNIAMANTLDAAIKRSSPVRIVPAISENNTNQVCIIAAPILSNKKTIGAVGLALNTSNNNVTTARLIELEQAAPILTRLLMESPVASRPADANKLLQLQTAFLQHSNLADAATAFANTLTSLLKFNRVSIGLMKNHQTRVIAISNQVDFKKNQDLIKTISTAMEEAADQAESIIYPLLADDKPRIHLAHKALVNKTTNATCSTPLIFKGNVIGVINFEHDSTSTINREAVIWYEHIANFFAPLLILKQDAEQTWYQRGIASFKKSWTRFITQENHTPKIVLASSILALLALSFIPMPYHIGASAHIEGATQRIISAPVEGFIQSATVRPGDTVKKGDVLVQLADQDLLLEKEKWESEIIQQENNFSGALARQDRTQYAISQAKAAQAQTELALVKHALARSQIVAPMNGVVLEGDLSQALGAPVKQGDRLMTIAPENQYRLMIDVDERDIKDISLGKKGSLALSAIPTEKLHFTVERITPMAIVKNGNNTYEVQATIADTDIYLRPGLQGVAKIEAGEKPILWSLSHRIIDWLQLTFWKWGF